MNILGLMLHRSTSTISTGALLQVLDEFLLLFKLLVGGSDSPIWSRKNIIFNYLIYSLNKYIKLAQTLFKMALFCVIVWMNERSN